MKNLVFFCFSIAVLAALPGVSGATHQYYCAGALYGDSSCSTASIINDWQGCVGGDQTNLCVQETGLQSPVGGTAANFFRKAEFCEPSPTCGHPSLVPLTVEISASPGSVTAGETTTLSWTASDAAVSCAASGAWTGAKALSDSERVTPSTTSTYTITCTDKQQQAASDSVTVTVTEPPPPQTSNTESTTQTVNAGGTVTTDTEGDGATPSDPIETSVTTQVAGQVVIVEVATNVSAPAGFSFLARQVNVQAPGSLNPLILSFRLHLNLVPAAANPNTIRVFKDRSPVAESCSEGSYPCVANTTVSGDNIVVTVHTLEASAWNFGFPEAVAAGGLVPCGGPGQPACQLCHVLELGHNVLELILVVIVPLATGLLFAWGGFVWLTAMGSPARVQQGKQILFAAVIGVLIVYGAWLFINLALQTLGAATFEGTGDWNKWWEIECKVPSACNNPSAQFTVFTTSTQYQGDTAGGASRDGSGADALCQQHAQTAGLSGRYAAWLSDGTNRPQDRGLSLCAVAADRSASWYLPDGATKVADNWEDLTDGTLDAPINQDEGGNLIASNNLVYTGTDASGNSQFVSGSPANDRQCQSWTFNINTCVGGGGNCLCLGNYQATDAQWSDSSPPLGPHCNYSCDNAARIYCFQYSE